MRKVANLIMLLLPWMLLSSQPESIKSFFYHLKQLEFEKAKMVSYQLEDTTVRNELERLAEILYYEGQKERDYFQLVLVSNRETESKELSVIRSLQKGYLDLFYNRAQGSAYREFYAAYQMANDLNKPFLIKACLLAFFKYHNYEFAQNSDSYKAYLEHFKKISSDSMDEIWVSIYEMIFWSKSFVEFDEDYFEVAKKLDRFENEVNINSPVLANIYYEKALMLDIQGEIESASEYYKKTIFLAKGYPFHKSLAFFSSIKLMMLETKRKNFQRANQFLESAQEHINTADPLRSDYYLNLNSAFFHREQEEKNIPYDFLLAAYRQEFELDFRRNTLEINRLNVVLENEKQLKENLQLRNKNLQAEAENDRNRGLLVASLISLILIASLAVLLHKNTSKKRKLAEQRQVLEKQKVETLLKEQELVSIDAMIAGQEKERQRVANELHDDLGSLMATVKLHFENINTAKDDDSLNNASELLEKAYQKIRGLAHSKNSGVMANQGLVPAVRKMAKTISEANKIKLDVTDFGLQDRMENSTELIIFRIVQELVTNVIKHSKATKAAINLTQHEDILNIVVEDNGTGFNTSTIKHSGEGMGLHNIEKRIEHLEGSFTIDSVADKGTSIIIDIPI
ncbi:sensor histidine kinase [Spongiimicrobium sp. 3-5]|uniref:sensor histidine kinase n=1 Tax=Spongiimicrobium sp. 3-5 TaxID=3332596 RepID=UPI0039806EFC